MIPALPAELWFHILSFLPKSKLRKLDFLGKNHVVAIVAAEIRCETLYLAGIGLEANFPGSFAKKLKHLHRVRWLYIRPYLRHNLYDFLPPSYKKRRGATVNSGLPIHRKRLSRDILSVIIQQLTRLEGISIHWDDGFKHEGIVSVLASGWVTFRQTLRYCAFKGVPHTLLPSILPIDVHLPNLEEFEFAFESQWGSGASFIHKQTQENAPIIHRFIAAHRERICELNLPLSLYSSLLESEVRPSKLEALVIKSPMAVDKQSVEHLHQFLMEYRNNIRSLNFSCEDANFHLLLHNISSVEEFPRLAEFKVAFTPNSHTYQWLRPEGDGSDSLHSISNFVDRHRETLVELSISENVKFSVPGVKTLLKGYNPSLRTLILALKVNPSVIDLLANNCTRLENLTLNVQEFRAADDSIDYTWMEYRRTVRGTAEFAVGMKNKSYPHWRLRHISSVIPTGSVYICFKANYGDDTTWNSAWAAIVRAVPNLETYNGYGRKYYLEHKC